jgi:hypothetical protein
MHTEYPLGNLMDINNLQNEGVLRMIILKWSSVKYVLILDVLP